MERTEFRRLMAERLAYPIGSPDYNYRTRAARQLLLMMRGIPVTEWTV